MASLTIRNLDSNVKEQLRQVAAQHGRSMEAEARAILSQALNLPFGGKDIAASIHSRFVSFALESLPVPARQEVRTPPEFRGE